MYFKILRLLTPIVLLIGCNSSNKNQEEIEEIDFTIVEKRTVHRLFLTEYLWYENTPSKINYKEYTSRQEFIEALKDKELDKWSFVETKEEYENRANQTTGGFGFRFIYDDFTIIETLIDSPAYNNLFRGDKILNLNGKKISYEAIREVSQDFYTPANFIVNRKDKNVTVTITPKPYTFKVTQAKILEKNIGFLRYESFSGASVNELEESFKLFRENNITKLIIDLRYNSGGSVDVASFLLDNILANQFGKEQFSLIWNDNYQENNEKIYFQEKDFQEGYELNTTEVVFLVTEATASASELVINSLKPYIKVSTIGTNTSGKGVGMSGKSFNGNYYFIINFMVQNSLGQTIDTNGIEATCYANDDFNHLRGDLNETLLKIGLFYLKNETCLD